MDRMRAVRCAMAATAMSLVALRAVAAPTAQEIVKKAEAGMKALKTYQATMQMNMSMGQMGSMSMQMDVKAIGDKKSTVNTKPIGTPTGGMAMGAQFLTMQIVNDGANTWMYMPAMKQYSKTASRAGGAATPFNVKDMFKNSDATYKLVGTESVGGRPAHVIQIIPKNQPASAKGSKILMYIDQATYRFRQMKMSGSAPGGGPNQPAQKMDMSIVVKSEKVNEPIADSVFKFTPPPGATQMQGGMGNPFGGMMGGGRRR